MTQDIHDSYNPDEGFRGSDAEGSAGGNVKGGWSTVNTPGAAGESNPRGADARQGPGQDWSSSRASSQGPARPFADHIRGLADQVEEELGHVIAYLNDEVVPQVRRNSSGALRSAASQLATLAERLDAGSRGRVRTEGDSAQRSTVNAADGKGGR